MFRRTPVSLFACLSIFAALVACNPSSDGEGTDDGDATPAASVDPAEVSGTLEVWGFGTEDAIGATRVASFEERFQNVTVNLTPGDFDTQKFLSAVASGTPPDVIYVPRDQVGSFATRGALVPLDGFIDASGMDLGIFYEATLSQVQLNGSTYGIPEFNNIIVAYLNNAALSAAGMSSDDVDFSDWDGLAEINRQLSVVEGDRVVRVGFDPKMPEFLPLWAAANGGSVMSEDGAEVTLDDPAVVEAVDYTAGLRGEIGQDKYSGFSQSWDIFGEQNPFVADQVGITLFEQWYLSVLADASPDADITVKPFTTREGGEPITWVSGNTWAMPEGSDSQQAAFEWMRHMTSTESWVEAAQASRDQVTAEGGIYTGTYTGNREADARIFSEVYEESGRASFDQAVRVILDLQETSFSLPANGAGAEIQQAYMDAVGEVLLGRTSAQDALASADGEAQQALDEANGS